MTDYRVYLSDAKNKTIRDCTSFNVEDGAIIFYKGRKADYLYPLRRVDKVKRV